MIHLYLFILTFQTTIVAGAGWQFGLADPYSFESYKAVLPYSLSLLFVLGCHEFGHYFAAKYHKVKVTLPYFIPFPFLFGTMGAVIRTKSAILHNKALFDIGIYGPICGFVASVAVLIYGFTHLPGIEYLLAIHPDYYSPEYAENEPILKFGKPFLLIVLQSLFTNPEQFVPPMSEIYHYPFLCAGWFGLFITAMNMIPVGQLDGGHIVYSMFGRHNHLKIGIISIVILIILGSAGIVDIQRGWPTEFGWPGWLVWAGVLYFVIKLKHPPVGVFHGLDINRKILGYFSFIILILTFSPTPFVSKFS